MKTRRTFLARTLAGAMAGVVAPRFARGKDTMYGLIGRMSAVEGKRDELIAALLDGIGEMPGCLSYVVATDPADPQALWITEVWQDEASHKASLSLPSVREAIRKGRPLIAKFEQSTVVTPVGGVGLP